MSVGRERIGSIRKVPIYAMNITAGLGAPTAEEWPQRSELPEDRLFRAVLAMQIRWTKTGGTDNVYAVQIGAENPAFYTSIWQRWMGSSITTTTGAALEGSETRITGSEYGAPDNSISLRPPFILPPGIGFRVIGGPSTFNLCTLIFTVAEATDPVELWPVINGIEGGIGNAIQPAGVGGSQ